MEKIGEEKRKINRGFAAIPQYVLNGFLIGDFSQRELLILLLVARLTYGCQSYCAEFYLKDLQIIGISKSHCGKLIKKLLREGWLLRGFELYQYFINEEKISQLVSDFENPKIIALSKLIGRNLFSETSIKYKKRYTKVGTNLIPKTQPVRSPFGNQTKHALASSIDNDGIDNSINRKTTGFSSKEVEIPGVGLNPHTFTSRTEEERKAIQTWATIEPNNPTAFGFYYDRIVTKRIPPRIVDMIVSQVKGRSYIDNPGAYFVKQLDEYIKFHQEELRELEEEEI